MKLVAGLGNPGRQYQGNRHNVGFRVLDELARRAKLALDAEKFEGAFALGQLGGEKVALLKPLTFMNLSGQSVVPAARFYKVSPADMMVVHDDLDLPLGRVQVKRGGSAGGHNGLKSIIGLLGDEGFVRVRLGIGRSGEPGQSKQQVVGHVLGDFAPDERELAEQMVQRAADAVVAVLEKGLDAAMNEFNRRPGT